MDQYMELVRETGHAYGVPVGNTAGWASVFWLEHPMLEWDFVKEVGLFAAELGASTGICSTVSPISANPSTCVCDGNGTIISRSRTSSEGRSKHI